MRTTGQNFLHSWRHFFGLHLSVFTMAMRVLASSFFDILLLLLLSNREPRVPGGVQSKLTSETLTLRSFFATRSSGVLAVSRKDSSRDSIVATSVAGVSAGLVASVITCPLDVVKTRMQAQAGASAHHVRYRGTLPSLRTILAEEGIRGLCTATSQPSTHSSSSSSYISMHQRITHHHRAQSILFRPHLFHGQTVACGRPWWGSRAIGLSTLRAMTAFKRLLALCERGSALVFCLLTAFSRSPPAAL
jgi:hypothetical protein